ncbi:hypothetical protein GDO86_010819 [Hymenochirus boettgeri]|uniref:Metadherin n=1 Tax=Hymenochirus boettgeri TaxID=247094 RepID=A0A8T2JE89_9PIPI|nr:hypothetical protein GDO86_010819 [Hymenochirus boettgeri]
MAAGWQEAVVQQAEEVSARVRQLVTAGLGILRQEYGVDLEWQPHKYPDWVFLAAPLALGLVLLLTLLFCVSPGKKRVKEQKEEEPVQQQNKVPVACKPPVRAEEPKKKTKKKPTEKVKPNGRPVEIPDEVIIPGVKNDNLKHPSDAEKKTEKTKKSKKKKSDPKQTQQSSNQDKKEAEEGNWETKISNREKRQQRRRDKGTDSDINVGETTSLVNEQLLYGSSSTGIRKSKGLGDGTVVNGSGWNEKPSKVLSSQLGEEKWTSSAPVVKKKAEACSWNQDANDANGKEWNAPWGGHPIFSSISAWSNVDGRMNAPEQRPPSFTAMGLNNSIPATVSEPVSQSAVPESQWDAAPIEPSIDDEWSGLNGLNSSDPTSDWNAPAEEWGNWGEEEPVNIPQSEEHEQELLKVSEEEKDKEDSAQGSGKSKPKKKKKKKKQGEELGSSTQDAENKEKKGTDEVKRSAPQAPSQPVRTTPAVALKKSESKKQSKEENRHHKMFSEPSIPVLQNISEKNTSQVQQAQETSSLISKQNSVPPSSKAKSEESWESPKQVKKKKKARRET